MSEPHAHLQTMKKTPANFQKGSNEIAGGVALKSIHSSEMPNILLLLAEKMTKLAVEKSEKDR